MPQYDAIGCSTGKWFINNTPLLLIRQGEFISIPSGLCIENVDKPPAKWGVLFKAINP